MLSNASWGLLTKLNKHMAEYIGKTYMLNGREIKIISYTLSGQLRYKDLETEEIKIIWEKELLESGK